MYTILGSIRISDIIVISTGGRVRVRVHYKFSTDKDYVRNAYALKKSLHLNYFFYEYK